MAKQIAKYKVVCDPPGMQIAGAGAFTKDSSGIFPPGTILNVRADFEPRACMWPMNSVAEQAFERKRKKWAEAWRTSLANGEDPSGRTLEGVELPMSKEAIEARVKKEIAKIGPIKGKAQKPMLKGRAPRLAPGTLLAQQEVAPKQRNELDDSLEDDAADATRASDAE